MISQTQSQCSFSKRKGTTLIESLILLAIFSIASMAFYEAFMLSTGHIMNAKKRLIAVGIATERMEVLRSLAYSEVAVAGGVPNGTLDPDEQVTVSGGQFRILTAITYFDDSDDGTLSAGTDSIPNDYKLVVIRVLWGNETAAETVALRSFFMPSGIETAAGGGILSINVIDANGQPVSGANVRIQNSTVSPAVDTTLVTATNGNAMLIGAKASNQKYALTVTKSGYETVTTLPPYPVTAFYPNDVHMTAINNAFTTSVIVSSLLSDVRLRSRDPLGEDVSNAHFSLIGGRVIGTTVTLQPVYNYSSSLVTDSTGEKILTDISPGGYQFTLAEAGFQLWKLEYGSTNNNQNQIILDPGTAPTVDVILMKTNQPGYFIRILNKNNDSPIENASVKLVNSALGYDVEETTDRYGYAYFPRELAEAVTNGVTYDVTVTHSDYVQKSSSVTINNLTTSTLKLDPN